VAGGLLPAAGRRVIDLGCGAGRHAVLLPGNIYGIVCALDDEGPHAKAVGLHGFVLRAAGYRGVRGRSECAPAWWSFGKCLPSVHAYDDFARCPGPRRPIFEFPRAETGMDSISRSTDFIRA
jgi:hypothetical protein